MNFMEKIEIVFNFMKQIVMGLVIEGLLAIIIGILIFVYPNLLGMLVGILLVVCGIISLILAMKIKKYSKFEVKI